MIRKIYIASILLISVLSVARAQHGLSFYHLGNATFQSTDYNPALLPDGKVFIGLPVISGVNAFFSSPVSYNQTFVRDETGANVINFSGIVDDFKANSMVASHVNVSLFHAGFRLRSGSAFTLFANARSSTDVTVPQETVDFFWRGNAFSVGEEVNFSNIGSTSNTFYEIGIGYANTVWDGRLNWGARVKYYQGIANASTAASFDMKILTEPQSFQLNAELQNGLFRTAGVEVIQGNQGDITTYAVSNANRGFGLDLGLDYRLNAYYSVQLAVTDIGYISWKEGIKNYRINADTSFRYSGVELKGADDVIQDIRDSLIDKFDITEEFESYTTVMPSQILGSWTWYSPYGFDMITTVGSRIIQAQPKMMYGLGLRKRFGPKLIVSATANKLPQQFFNVGAAVSATAGFAQFYLAADRLIGLSVPDMKWAEVRFGINFVFGSGRKTSRDDDLMHNTSYGSLKNGKRKENGVQSNMFLGRQVKAKRVEGIYTVIEKQDKPKGNTATPDIDREGRSPGPPATNTGSDQNALQNVRTGVPASASGNQQGLFNKNTAKPASASGGQQRLFNKNTAKPASATGSQQGLFNKKTSPPASASGKQNRIFGRKKAAPASATGSQQKLFKGKKSAASSSGRVNFGKRKSNKNSRSKKPKFKKKN